MLLGTSIIIKLSSLFFSNLQLIPCKTGRYAFCMQHCLHYRHGDHQGDHQGDFPRTSCYDLFRNILHSERCFKHLLCYFLTWLHCDLCACHYRYRQLRFGQGQGAAHNRQDSFHRRFA